MRRSTRHERCAILAVATSSILTLAAPLSAGTVTFEPSALTVQQGETASIVVGIDDTGNAIFNAFGLFVSMTDSPELLSGRIAFDYVPGHWQQPEPSPEYPMPAVCIADRCGFGVGGYRSFPQPYSSPLIIGTFTLDTSGLPLGTYDLITSTAWESQVGEPFSGLRYLDGPIEPLEGRATLTIVPEPASLLLLTLAAALIARRDVINPRHRCSSVQSVDQPCPKRGIGM